MFWDFGSLHQKHRVGGTHGRVRRDGSGGWRSPVPGATILGASWSSSSANHPVSVPPTGPELPERSLLFWDFSSLYQRRCGVIPHALSRQPYFRLCRSGDFGFVSRHKPPEHRIPDVSAAPTLRRHVSRPVAAGVSPSLKDVAASQHVCDCGAATLSSHDSSFRSDSSSTSSQWCYRRSRVHGELHRSDGDCLPKCNTGDALVDVGCVERHAVQIENVPRCTMRVGFLDPFGIVIPKFQFRGLVRCARAGVRSSTCRLWTEVVQEVIRVAWKLENSSNRCQVKFPLRSKHALAGMLSTTSSLKSFVCSRK